MAKAIIFLIVIFAISWVIFRLVARKRRDPINIKSESESTMADAETTEDNSGWGTCKSCGQKRIIMKEGLCAYCWSTSQTQGLK